MQDSFYRVSCQPDILTCRFNKYLKYKYNYLLFAKILWSLWDQRLMPQILESSLTHCFTHTKCKVFYASNLSWVYLFYCSEFLFQTVISFSWNTDLLVLPEDLSHLLSQHPTQTEFSQGETLLTNVYQLSWLQWLSLNPIFSTFERIQNFICPFIWAIYPWRPSLLLYMYKSSLNLPSK